MGYTMEYTAPPCDRHGLGGEVSTQWPCFLGQEVNLLKLESSYSSTDIQMYQKKTYCLCSKQIH